jgi:hypothetical protein
VVLLLKTRPVNACRSRNLGSYSCSGLFHGVCHPQWLYSSKSLQKCARVSSVNHVHSLTYLASVPQIPTWYEQSSFLMCELHFLFIFFDTTIQFYWLFEAQQNPAESPLVLWLSGTILMLQLNGVRTKGVLFLVGGPGCSGGLAIFYVRSAQCL